MEQVGVQWEAGRAEDGLSAGAGHLRPPSLTVQNEVVLRGEGQRSWGECGGFLRWGRGNRLP